MIKPESIQRLIEQTDIVDVVSRYVNLKRSGRNFVGICPFHDDKNPSMSVSPELNIYHCFSCKAGGNAINFIKEYEKLNYPEAVEKLASMQNFTLEYTDEKSNFKKLDKEALSIVKAYYQSLLYQNKAAIDYLYSRGFNDELIAKFELGYAPNSQNTLNLLSNEKIDPKDAINLGIVKVGEGGNLYASFIDRIIFTINNHAGKIVGFGGRTITNHPAKYVNSPQSSVFDKSQIFYAYDKAKDEIYKLKEIIITEGYMDTIMLHKAGHKNAVAVLGTALTPKHLPLLRRSNAKITLCFDGDSAGINAAFKSSKLLLQNDFDTSVVVIPKGADPADLVQAGNLKELDKILNSKTEAGEFVIRQIANEFELQRPVQKQLALDEIVKFTKTLNPIVADSYKSLVSMILGISIDSFSLSNSSQNSIKSIPNFAKFEKKKDYLELQIIKTLYLNKEFFNKCKDMFLDAKFQTHEDEFKALLRTQKTPEDEIMLREISIDIGIDEFKSIDELSRAYKILIINTYENMLKNLKNSDIENKQEKIKQVQRRIIKLKGVK
ncbi:DNA primase [Campylobacter ureolyticus]|uniref:DNA primase n=1 Tax=Campylobacter ureolyticus TaxID=827 RepID=A0A9Q4KQL2_9BACT|nr:DNA primase [Campylobacter ureolyticus]MCZ6104370.1 DNA primase [Campylobacter ureolyticus]MCZ6135634.1 DNA primase [Campylobacter ureolyticus]MCZ6162372.1 DNA primase [Campylobacter ureolyticus]MCZ6171393.1 DNA primase [Campylobacter ureolyticus]MDU4982419.1 DNA primase [Campylobacter ureolyticus]